MINYRMTIETLNDIKATKPEDIYNALMARIGTIEIPLSEFHYDIRTCRWQNRKKFRRAIIKSLSSRSLGSFTGVSVIRELNVKEY